MSERLCPDWFDAWAAAHRPMLELIVERLLAAGEWPTEAELQRQLVLDGTPIAVADALARMPRPLGFRDGARIVLSLFGLRYVPGAQPLLAAFVDALQLAAGRYRDPAQLQPVLRSSDVPVPVAREIVAREAPFLGSTVPSDPGQQAWTREITGDIARYLDIDTIDAYLARRRDEQQDSPHLGWRRATIIEPQPPAQRRASALAAWDRVSRHPLWSAVLAALIAAAIVALLHSAL